MRRYERGLGAQAAFRGGKGFVRIWGSVRRMRSGVLPVHRRQAKAIGLQGGPTRQKWEREVESVEMVREKLVRNDKVHRIILEGSVT